MPRIISVGKESVWHKFNSLDLFTRLVIITLILFAIATPFIVYNYQLFNANGEAQNQRLKEISQIKGYQNNLQNNLARSSVEANISAEKADAKISTSTTNFNLISAIWKIFADIAGFFNK